MSLAPSPGREVRRPWFPACKTRRACSVALMRDCVRWGSGWRIVRIRRWARLGVDAAPGARPKGSGQIASAPGIRRRRTAGDQGEECCVRGVAPAWPRTLTVHESSLLATILFEMLAIICMPCYSVSDGANVIENHLSEILGRRRMNISDLAHGAGISRATASKMYHDRSESFDREVLNKVCACLGVSVCELLVYVPDTERIDKSASGDE